MEEKILIVDDEPRYLRLMEANLTTEGYEVFKATNGQEAVEMVAEVQPDLLLLDVMMPVLDGFGACERGRNVRPRDREARRRLVSDGRQVSQAAWPDSKSFRVRSSDRGRRPDDQRLEDRQAEDQE